MVAVVLVVVSATLIVAVDARAEVVSYPKLFASETTLERSDALSKNISLASIFALKAR